jgi:DNA-binding CsgD family transcriptional regulator
VFEVLDWPFIGRHDDLRRLHGLMIEGARGVVVAGPSGVGKTRLAAECLRLAESDGLSTLRATATRSAASLPFGALAGLLPDDGHAPGSVDDRADLLRRSAAAMVESSGGRQLLMFVDDAHLLDDDSATLVHQLASTRTAFVLVTTVTGERAPDPVVALWRDSLVERVELGTLSTAAIEELLSAVLDGPIDPAAVAELAGRAQGNVLFLRELVLGALQDGILVEEGGLWLLRGALSPSNRLVELVEARLEGVDLAGRGLLELVAYGEPLGEAELSVPSDPTVVESLERRGLLASSTSGRRLEVRLSHPIYGDVLRARIPAVRERAIARALAEAVEATGARRRNDALRVASWRLTGGGGEPEVLLAGANEARWRYDFPLGERLARAALDAGAGCEARLLAAQLVGLQGRSAEAEQELAALAHQATDDDQRGAVALARIHNSVTWTGHDAFRIIDEAEATITETGWRDRLAAERLVLLNLTRGPETTAEAAAPLLDRAEGAALAVACIPAATSLARLGRIDDALDASERGYAAQMATPTPLAWYPWWHAVARCHALRYAGRFEEAESLATSHYQQALIDQSTEAQAIFALMPACAVAERGRVQTAARRVREALALSHELGRPLLARLCHVHGALALALAGRAQEAEEALAELDALLLPSVLDDVDVIRAWAWVAVAAGELPEAERHLKQAVTLGEEIGDRVGVATALHSLARLGHASDVHDRLAEVAGHVEGRLTPARVAHTAALAHHDAAGLEAVSRDFEAMGADVLAAEAAADAAVVRRRDGEMRAATGDEHRAAILAQRCENPVTPALQAIEAKARLTASERETALLATAGFTSRQIAEHLHLSVRTVENRLQHVYEKLGINRRTDLAEALHQDPPPTR